MTPPILHLVVPGALDQLTGGYIYDARMAEGLRGLGWTVRVHNLDGRFPGPGTEAGLALERTLWALPDDACVLLDGLALGGLPEPAERHAGRLRLVALVHHPLCDETGIPDALSLELRNLEARALRACRGIIVSSAFTARRLRNWLGDATRIETVNPGTTPASRAWASVPTSAPRLLCVGSVIPRKGQDLLLQALEKLKECPWQCVIAGSLDRDPVFARRVQQQARQAGLEPRVMFPGECSTQSLDALYRSSSLFVLPSWYEGFGMAFAEAMAHGLPILATTGGAIPDTVPASAGVLVEPGNPELLYRALARILDDSALRTRLGEGAWRHARSLPDWPAAAARFQAVLRDLAAV